jgi:hypothetical protein
MKLLSFETKVDTDNVRLFLQKIGESPLLATVSSSYFFLGISGIAGFWISAVHIDCHYRFKWCGTGGALLRNDSRWHKQSS